VISTEDGGGGDGGLRAIEGTAGNSLSSNKRQLLVLLKGCCGGLFGGVVISRNGNGDKGNSDEPMRGVRGEAIFLGVVRGEGFGKGL